MTTDDFLDNFDDKDFPSQFGRWLNEESFDPPFRKKSLDQMDQRGLIEYDREHSRFRLTLRASRIRGKDEE